MILYHGTSDVWLDTIRKEGIKDVYLTDRIELADYYAEEAVAEDGGNDIVLRVDVSEEHLRFDGNAVDEPVSFGDYNLQDLESIVQEMWDEEEKKNPSWMKGDVILIPEKRWDLSLKTVASCRYEGVIPPSNITVEE